MTRISIDTARTLGKIKPMHGVGQPPLQTDKTDHFHYLEEANIPYSRLHDVGGRFGGNLFVDIPNIFRDFSADENDPASYDFAFTDILISALIEVKCEPIFRLGVSIENFHKIKAYRIFPPADMPKWARICEHIIRHYNEGWADGYHYGITYWEIWNEPDGHPDISENAMWKGTKEEYYELYRVTSKHLRACFGDSIKIGGYASCGFYVARSVQDVTGVAFGVSTEIEMQAWMRRIEYFVEFFHGFIDMVKRENLPFDFFSHHSYASVIGTKEMQACCERLLEEAGFSDVEIHLNEWNTDPGTQYKGTSMACANVVATMCAMQRTKMALMCYYDAQMTLSSYGGLFNPITKAPYCAYDGFKAFGKLYALGTEVACSSDNGEVYATAATDGKAFALLLSNIGEDTTVKIDGLDGFSAYLIDSENSFTPINVCENSFNVKKHQVVYLEALGK